jgi:arylsulfatase
MEVFAGFLAHTDAQVNRVISKIEEMGQFDNTLVIYLTGDNGASAEGTVHGAWSAPSFQNGVHEDPEWLLEHMADFGTARCENHFNVGWAWALDSPFQWMKQVASHFGGTRNAMAISWPAGIVSKGEMRSHFHHVIDLFPTILDVLEVEVPARVNGVVQQPVQGTSMVYSFSDSGKESRRKTQYFEILGNRGIYHDGWMASCFHGRLPWIRFAGYEFDGPQEVWELYNIAEDFSQANDLAEVETEKLATLRALFETEAERYGVYPLRDASGRRSGAYAVPHSLEGHQQMTYTRAHVRMPEHSVVSLKNTSFSIAAEVMSPEGGCQGVIACQGGNMGGWSLYVDQSGLASFVYNWFGHEFTLLQDSTALIPGSCNLEVLYEHEGHFGGGGKVVLQANGMVVAQGSIPRTVPVIFSMSGETFDVGVDTGSPVGHYPHTFAFNGEIKGVTLKRLTEPDAAVKAAERKGRFQASLSSQ